MANTPIKQDLSPKGHGWRAATWGVAAAAVTVVPLAIFFVKDDPAPLGLRPFGLPDDESLLAPVQRNPLADALSGLFLGLRSRDFSMLAARFSFAAQPPTAWWGPL